MNAGFIPCFSVVKTELDPRDAAIATERHAFHFEGTRKFTEKKPRFVIRHIDAGARWNNEVRTPALRFVKSFCLRRRDLDSREPFHVLFSEIAGHDDPRGITVPMRQLRTVHFVSDKRGRIHGLLERNRVAVIIDAPQTDSCGIGKGHRRVEQIMHRHTFRNGVAD